MISIGDIVKCESHCTKISIPEALVWRTEDIGFTVCSLYKGANIPTSYFFAADELTVVETPKFEKDARRIIKLLLREYFDRLTNFEILQLDARLKK